MDKQKKVMDAQMDEQEEREEELETTTMDIIFATERTFIEMSKASKKLESVID